MSRSVLILLFLMCLILCDLGCAKAPKAEGTANAPSSDRPEVAVPVHRQENLYGDIERTSLAISSARDAHRLGKWDDAIKQLQAAEKEIDTALGRKLRIREEWEALKAAIAKTIVTLQNRGKEADAQLTELQTRISAIKVNTPRPPGI